VSIEIANALRLLVLSEIAFGLGFFAFRIWKRHRPWAYLSIMGMALALYSVFAAAVLISRYNQPVSWRTPFAGVCATVALIGILREGGKHPYMEEDE
jgi:hypothetical protein